MLEGDTSRRQRRFTRGPGHAHRCFIANQGNLHPSIVTHHGGSRNELAQRPSFMGIASWTASTLHLAHRSHRRTALQHSGCPSWSVAVFVVDSARADSRFRPRFDGPHGCCSFAPFLPGRVGDSACKSRRLESRCGRSVPGRLRSIARRGGGLPAAGKTPSCWSCDCRLQVRIPLATLVEIAGRRSPRESAPTEASTNINVPFVAPRCSELGRHRCRAMDPVRASRCCVVRRNNASPIPCRRAGHLLLERRFLQPGTSWYQRKLNTSAVRLDDDRGLSSD